MRHVHHNHQDHHNHDHDDHGESDSRWGRLRHTLSGLVGGHTHDSAGQVDTALEADRTGRRALWLSLAGLAVTAALQGVVVVLSGSVALLGDTLHNIADALTAVPLLVAFRPARRPANTRYTHGYGRAEDLAESIFPPGFRRTSSPARTHPLRPCMGSRSLRRVQ